MYIDTLDDAQAGRVCLNAFMADQLRTGRTINGITFNGSANITNYGVCNTAASTAAKTVTVNSTFVLAEGAQVVVKFDQKNTATSPTLNVNGTGAKPIVIYGVTGSSTNVTPVGSNAIVDSWIEGAVQTFTYDGTNWVRDYWYNTTYTTRPISQTVATDNAEYPLLSRTTTSTDTSNGHAKFAAGVTLNPSSNTITATTFVGNLRGNADTATTASSCSGNAATATKLQTARTISLTGDVTGSGTFDGSNDLSIAATVADNSHNHTYVKLGGANPLTGSEDTVNNWIVKKNNSTWWYDHTGTLPDKPSEYGFIWQLVNHSDINQLWFSQASGKMMRRSGNSSGWATPWKQIWCQGDAVTGAVWNDYAEYRESYCEEFGYVLMETGDDSLTKTTERLSHFAGVSSDTWGFSQGETARARTPIAVAGRVLVYPYQDRNNYKPGDCVCAAPDGTVDIMTREEVREWPDRIVGTVSCVPNYEEWGGGEGADRDPVKVNGRIWIKVK